MTLSAQPLPAVPAETARVARAAFPQGNRYLTLRDELGPIYEAQAFAAVYAATGQRGLSPVVLTLVTILQFMENLSDRAAADAVRGRIDWKYFWGLELTDEGFDYSALSEFRGRLLQGNAEALLLDRVLAVAQARGWVKARGQQRTDATQVVAAIRRLHRLEMVGETLRATLNALATVAPNWLRSWVPASWYERYGRRIEASRVAPKPADYQPWVLQVGRDGHALLDQVGAMTTPAEVKEHPSVALLRRVWIQQYYLAEDTLQWRESGNLPPAAVLLQSPYDPDAHYSRKREQEWLGYKVHLTETCDPELPHLITQVTTTPAPCPDDQALPTIQAALAVKALLPAEQVVDHGYTSAPNLVQAQQHHAIQLIGPVATDTSWQAQQSPTYNAAHFQVDWTQQQVRCPQGHWSTLWVPHQNARGREVIDVRFAPATCHACPQRPQCTQAKTGPRALKLLPQAEYEALAAARYAQTQPAFKPAYAIRAGVEATHSQAVRACGLRRSRYCRLAKTHLQNIFIAVAVNLIRLAEWLCDPSPFRLKPTAFARLAPI